VWFEIMLHDRPLLPINFLEFQPFFRSRITNELFLKTVVEKLTISVRINYCIYNMATLHIFSDGSTMRTMFARDLARLPIWQGNRVLNQEHKASIQAQIQQNLQVLDMKPYHIVTYTKELSDSSTELVSEIVDGQHRVSILKDHFADEHQQKQRTDLEVLLNPPKQLVPEGFQVLVIERRCQSESEIIEYFRILNTTKAIEWRDDPVVAANRYLDALLKKFNTPSKQLIRQGRTRIPYVSLDIVRHEMIKRRVGLGMNETPEAYANRIFQEHQTALKELAESGASCKEEEVCLKSGCLLLIVKNYDWLNPQ
jgi:hypothetical protein